MTATGVIEDTGALCDRFLVQIAAALAEAGGTHAFEDVKTGVIAGDFQLFHGDQSVVITQIQVFPRRKLFCLFLAGGKMEELRSMLPGILEWGKAQGCDGVFLVGRAGWARSWLVEEDWRPSAVVMERPL